LFREGGKELYVDDLVTDETRRGSGIGHELITWLKAECKKEQCVGLVLDSDQVRKDAYRFYVREGMDTTALHFYRSKSPELEHQSSKLDVDKTTNALTIKNCVTPEEIKSTFTIMRQLRPNIKNDQYIELINSLKTTESYQLIAAYNADNVCVAVAGIRFRCSLFREGGKELYVDDLVTDETRRGSGIGHELMIWLKAACKKEQCAGIVLDSGLTRKDAHRFYQREGMSATAFHFYRAKSPERDSKTSIVDSKKDINWDSRISLKR
jgi:GNAT superfamily N-acetyltransferase